MSDVQRKQYGILASFDEAKLIQRAQRGEVAAFNQLVATYERVAYNLAYRLLGDPDQAADITQDAFISAYRSIERFRGTAFRAWLLRIVANACYDVLRARKRHAETSLDAILDDPEHPVNIEDPLPSPEDTALRHELMAKVQEGLLALPEDQRTVVVLADVQGFAYEEIAQITGAELGTVKSRLSRGRSRLRDFLRRQGELLPRQYRLTE